MRPSCSGPSSTAWQSDTSSRASQAAYWWMLEYNEERPHDSLGDMTPASTVKPPEIQLLKCLLDGEAYAAPAPCHPHYEG
ncbi:transposase [Luteimonas granuli]|uniref:Transposase n=1 Tax=Luteimonas granuli TaxID=1176533 RepID=A0A518N6L9_9GAMM|nr:transposase [Luteimonas granuli]